MEISDLLKEPARCIGSELWSGDLHIADIKMIDYANKDKIYLSMKTVSEINVFIAKCINDSLNPKTTKVLEREGWIGGQQIFIKYLDCCKTPDYNENNYCPSCGAKIVRE